MSRADSAGKHLTVTMRVSESQGHGAGAFIQNDTKSWQLILALHALQTCSTLAKESHQPEDLMSSHTKYFLCHPFPKLLSKCHQVYSVQAVPARSQGATNEVFEDSNTLPTAALAPVCSLRCIHRNGIFCIST